MPVNSAYGCSRFHTYILYIPTYIYNYIQNSMTPPSNQLLKVCGSIIQISGMYILGRCIQFGQMVKESREKPNKSWL